MNNKGFSLVEMLIAIFIFGILGVITTQIIFFSVSGAGKSESIIKVRENLNYAVGIMEREIRNANANSVSCGTNSIAYTNSVGRPGSFACVTDGSGTHIASSSATQITASDVDITTCSLTCLTGASQGVAISLKSGNVDVTTQIYLRNY